MFPEFDSYRHNSEIMKFHNTTPNHKQVNSTVELYSINGDERIKRKMPAVHLCWLLFSERLYTYLFFYFT